MTNQEVMSGMSDPDEVLSATVEKEELYYSLQAHNSVPSKLGQKKRLVTQVWCRAWKEITVDVCEWNGMDWFQLYSCGSLAFVI